MVIVINTCFGFLTFLIQPRSIQDKFAEISDEIKTVSTANPNNTKHEYVEIRYISWKKNILWTATGQPGMRVVATAAATAVAEASPVVLVGGAAGAAALAGEESWYSRLALQHRYISFCSFICLFDWVDYLFVWFDWSTGRLLGLQLHECMHEWISEWTMERVWTKKNRMNEPSSKGLFEFLFRWIPSHILTQSPYLSQLQSSRRLRSHEGSRTSSRHGSALARHRARPGTAATGTGEGARLMSWTLKKVEGK